MLARLSEKTIELNVCAQLNAFTARRLIWFGLTQDQEARMGFDACTRIGGKLLILQFKASNETIGGLRRFRAQHNQLVELRRRAKSFMRSVFYAFPLIGSWTELVRDSDFLTQTWLLDVATLRPIKRPTTAAGKPRKSGYHYVDVKPGLAVIHSDPVAEQLISLHETAGGGGRAFEQADGLIDLFQNDVERFLDFRRFLSKGAVGVVVPRAS